MKIAGASLNQTPIAWEDNKSNILSAIERAKNEQVELLCLPELCIPSYGCQDLFLAPWVIDKSLDVLTEIVPYTDNIAVSIGIPIRLQGKLYNTVAFIENQRIHGFYAKQILANDGVHYEARWFSPWLQKTQSIFSFQGEEYPFGEVIFDYKGKRIGFEICEDAWHEESRPANYYSQVDIILNPSASHFAFGKAQFREELIRSSSEKFQCTYVYVNLLGNESGRVIFDGDILIAENGVLKAKSNRLGFENVNLLMAGKENLSLSEFDYYHEFVKLQSLALFDYLRKSKSQGFVLSLSGGADSSSIAVLVSEMIKRGVKQLGLDVFKNKLGHIAAIQQATSIQQITEQLLTCVYQSTDNSSFATTQSAEELTKELGATFHLWECPGGCKWGN